MGYETFKTIQEIFSMFKNSILLMFGHMPFSDQLIHLSAAHNELHSDKMLAQKKNVLVSESSNCTNVGGRE